MRGICIGEKENSGVFTPDILVDLNNINLINIFPNYKNPSCFFSISLTYLLSSPSILSLPSIVFS